MNSERGGRREATGGWKEQRQDACCGYETSTNATRRNGATQGGRLVVSRRTHGAKPGPPFEVGYSTKQRTVQINSSNASLRGRVRSSQCQTRLRAEQTHTETMTETSINKQKRVFAADSLAPDGTKRVCPPTTPPESTLTAHGMPAIAYSYPTPSQRNG